MLRILLLSALICSGIFHSFGQICTGSLGDPIVNITFGSGSNPGPQLSSAGVGYQYVSNDCPGDGQYTVRNSTQGCFGDTWHTINDHTGNGNGYFMLVNASVAPNPFYVETVTGLCGNTTYEFSAWVVNMLKPSACGANGIQPDLTFRIEKADGTVIQSYNTNNIAPTASPQWRQFGFFFTTTAGTTDVVLRIINNANGGCGNDLALDDITFRPCGPQITTSINGTGGNTASHCEASSQSYTFNANVSTGFNNPVVQWQESVNNGNWTDIAGAASTTYTKNFSASAAAGSYRYRLTAAENGNLGITQCRVNAPIIAITVNANPRPAPSVTAPVCAGENFTLSATGTVVNWAGPNGYAASGNNVVISNAVSTQSGKYYVTAANGTCTRMDSVLVQVNPKPVVSADNMLIDLCKGDSALVLLSGADGYIWNPFAGENNTGTAAWVKPQDTTLYQVTGVLLGCKDTIYIQVNVADKPEANAGSDKTVVQGSTVQLNGSVSGDGVVYTWLPDYAITGVQSLQPFVSPMVDTFYILTAQSQVGCGTDSDTVRVKVFKKLLIPNAFSPNGDGINDKWMIGGIESYSNAKVQVFDRYGRQVFQSTAFAGWNGSYKGKALPAGTYYYIIDRGNGFAILAGWVVILY